VVVLLRTGVLLAAWLAAPCEGVETAPGVVHVLDPLAETVGGDVMEEIIINELADDGRRTVLDVEVRDAITREHAISLAAHELTAKGWGDAEGPIAIFILHNRPDTYRLKYVLGEPDEDIHIYHMW